MGTPYKTTFVYHFVVNYAMRGKIIPLEEKAHSHRLGTGMNDNGGRQFIDWNIGDALSLLIKVAVSRSLSS
jgi:hypothetical protein